MSSLSTVLLTALLVVTAASPSSYWPSGPLVFAVAGVALFHSALSGRMAGPHWTVLLFMLWCVLTLAWSETPSESIKGIIILVVSTLAVSFLVGQLGPSRSYRCLASALKVLIVLSWLLFLAVPRVGREQEAYHYGALTGVFVQRNAAAFVLAVAVLTFIFLAKVRGPRRTFSSVGWAVVAFATLVATESGTGLAVAVVTSVAMIFTLFMRGWPLWSRWSVVVLVLAALGAVALSVQTGLSFVTKLLGRDDTLTGRTVIWAAVEPYVRARPWQGYGWAALWTDKSLVTRAMWSVAKFPFPHAHDAYLDALAQSGIIGLVLIMLICGSILLRAGRRLLSPRGSVSAAWPMIVTLLLLLYGISEQSFVSYFGWLVLVIASAFIHAGESRSTADERPGDGAHAGRAGMAVVPAEPLSSGPRDRRELDPPPGEGPA